MSTENRYDETPLAREIADLARRRVALAEQSLPLPTRTRTFTVAELAAEWLSGQARMLGIHRFASMHQNAASIA